MLIGCSSHDQDGYALGFEHFPRDLANVNEWKIMFDPSSDLSHLATGVAYKLKNSLSHQFVVSAQSDQS